MHFAIDYLTTSILLGFLLLFGFLKIHFFSHPHVPSLSFSRLKDIKLISWKSQLAHLPKNLHIIALSAFMLAFIDPHFLIPKPPLAMPTPTSELPTEGIAIYLVLDQSGSMAQQIEVVNENGKKESISKIDLLKKVTKQFILNHPSDLIGMIAFARVPRVIVPLTLDQNTLLKQLENLQNVKSPENDGTAMGYAIFKTANLITATRHFAKEIKQERPPPYEIKSAIMIVVTDGFQDPNRLDFGNRLRTLELDDAASYAKSQELRMYIINIDPALASSQYAPQRRQLQSIANQTGGQFYLTSDSQALQDIYQRIDQLEKGKIFQISKTLDEKTAYSRFSLYPFFIFLGLTCLLAALVLEALIIKVVP